MQRTVSVLDMYVYAEPTWSTLDLSGFSVEALDGDIGKVDETTHEVGSGTLIVDTGPWIFGRKVMVPASFIARIDEIDRRVWVDLSKDQIKNAPEFDESSFNNAAYRDELATYYSTIEPGGPFNRPAGPDYGKDDIGS
jgi:hypothetical protein